MANTQTKSVEELLKDKNYNGYYRCEKIYGELEDALRATRQQQGMSIKDVATCLRKVFDKAEMAQLKKLL